MKSLIIGAIATAAVGTMSAGEARADHNDGRRGRSSFNLWIGNGGFSFGINRGFLPQRRFIGGNNFGFHNNGWNRGWGNSWGNSWHNGWRSGWGQNSWRGNRWGNSRRGGGRSQFGNRGRGGGHSGHNHGRGGRRGGRRR